MSLPTYVQRRNQGYITIPEAALILGCHDSTITFKRQQFQDLFVPVEGVKAEYMIKASDVSKLEISPKRQYYLGLGERSEKYILPTFLVILFVLSIINPFIIAFYYTNESNFNLGAIPIDFNSSIKSLNA